MHPHSARGEALSGEQAFAACAACHSLSADSDGKIGPSLRGVLGRDAAALPGYNYSPALRDSGLRWTRENLLAWIAACEYRVPGTWMLYDNVLTGEEASALIDYLEQESQQPAP
jgi:cytochrome c2